MVIDPEFLFGLFIIIPAAAVLCGWISVAVPLVHDLYHLWLESGDVPVKRTPDKSGASTGSDGFEKSRPAAHDRIRISPSRKHG